MRWPSPGAGELQSPGMQEQAIEPVRARAATCRCRTRDRPRPDGRSRRDGRGSGASARSRDRAPAASTGEPLADAVARRRRRVPRGRRPSCVRCFGSRPIGASIRPTAALTLPATSAWYVLRIRRAFSWAISECCAASCLATISSPLVSRSSRWTMPGRATPAMPPYSAPPARASRALTSVSPSW